MPSWLAQSSPKLFSDLAIPSPLIEMLEKATVQSNPPHLLIAGPSGVGKSTIVNLVARQLLGPGWKATTHVLQARDLLGKPGAMSVFEAFYGQRVIPRPIRLQEEQAWTHLTNR